MRGPVLSGRPGTQAAGPGGFGAVLMPAQTCPRSLTPRPSRRSPGLSVPSTDRWQPAPGLEGTVVPQALPTGVLLPLALPSAPGPRVADVRPPDLGGGTPACRPAVSQPQPRVTSLLPPPLRVLGCGGRGGVRKRVAGFWCKIQAPNLWWPLPAN